MAICNTHTLIRNLFFGNISDMFWQKSTIRQLKVDHYIIFADGFLPWRISHIPWVPYRCFSAMVPMDIHRAPRLGNDFSNLRVGPVLIFF